MAEIFLTPGLGGERVIRRQRKFVELLNSRRKRQIFFFDPRWQTEERAGDKLTRLHEAYEQAGKPHTLFGISAGATMAVILGQEYPETEIITLAGKHTGAGTIGAERRARAPALMEFVEMSEQVLASGLSVQRRMTSYHPFLSDGVVPKDDIVVAGAHNKTLPLPLHSSAIVSGLVTVLPHVG
jgi:hypothetical protein